jgi:hypothetical protein
MVRDGEGKPVHAYARDRRVQLDYSEYHQLLVRAFLAAACAPLMPEGGADRLWQRLRLAVEIGFAADEMLYEETRIAPDAALADVAAMLRAALLDLAAPR